MKHIMSAVVQAILKSIGLKTLNAQFLFSYVMIFVFACVIAASLYLSLGSDATTINMAGSQRMLSQRVAKEALMVHGGVESKAAVEKTIARFESNQKALLEGDKSKGITAIQEEVIRSQLDHVWKLWLEYKQSVLSYIESGDKDQLENMHKQSPVVLKEMHKAVGMMAKNANETVQQQQWMALAMTASILFLVVMGRMFGLAHLMDKIAVLKGRLQLVSEGDFSKPVEVQDAENEMGQMYIAYNLMLEKVGSVIQGVNAAVETVNQSAEQVTAAADQTGGGVQQQKIEIDQVATAMNEMSMTVNEVAQHTEQAATAANEAVSSAQDGHRVVTNTQGNMKTMAQQFEHTSQVVDSLNQDSEEVGKVLEVITSIAEQTNLLALNAAIEAARAGEQGRGFAVVADEVRTLAQRTQDSTGEIRQIIERLQSQAGEAVSGMSESLELAQRSLSHTDDATQALEKILSVADSIASMNDQIATAANEQRQVSEVMDKNITNIATVAQQTTDVAMETVNVSGNIRSQMVELRGLAGQFKT